jgi:hypothetical protein
MVIKKRFVIKQLRRNTPYNEATGRELQSWFIALECVELPKNIADIFQNEHVQHKEALWQVQQELEELFHKNYECLDEFKIFDNEIKQYIFMTREDL